MHRLYLFYTQALLDIVSDQLSLEIISIAGHVQGNHLVGMYNQTEV